VDGMFCASSSGFPRPIANFSRKGEFETFASVWFSVKLTLKREVESLCLILLGDAGKASSDLDILFKNSSVGWC